MNVKNVPFKQDKISVYDGDFYTKPPAKPLGYVPFQVQQAFGTVFVLDTAAIDKL